VDGMLVIPAWTAGIQWPGMVLGRSRPFALHAGNPYRHEESL